MMPARNDSGHLREHISITYTWSSLKRLVWDNGESGRSEVVDAW